MFGAEKLAFDMGKKTFVLGKVGNEALESSSNLQKRYSDWAKSSCPCLP